MRVMVIGASSDRTKFGNKAVRAFLAQGDTVLPVNPKGGQIEGQRVYTSIADVEGPVDKASVYLPAERGVQAVRELADRGDVAELWLNPGADDPAVVEEAKKLGLQPIIACSIIAVGDMPD